MGDGGMAADLMRAIYVQDLGLAKLPLPANFPGRGDPEEEKTWAWPSPVSYALSLSPTTWHHLKNVVRLQTGEAIRVLNGQGLILQATVQQWQDDHLSLLLNTLQQGRPPRPWDLVIGLTKDFDEVIRVAQELGVRRLYPWNSQFSNHPAIKQLNAGRPGRADHTPPSIIARWSRIITTAIEQSNAPWKLELDLSLSVLDKAAALRQLMSYAAHYPQVYTAHVSAAPSLKAQSDEAQSLLLVIGPEGGLAEEEVADLQKIAAVKFLALPTPILRTPTAVSTLYGYLLN